MSFSSSSHASSSRRKPTTMPVWLLLSCVPSVLGDTTSPSDLPQVDFSRMGTVALGGNFQGLDWWSPQSQFSSSSSSPSSSSSSSSHPSFSTTSDTVFLQSSDGSYQPLGNTNAGGVINSLCWANSTSSSSSNGTIYLAGSFSSIDGTKANNVASYSLSSNSFSALSNGIDGVVNVLYCDNANGAVWAGGDFDNHVSVWSTSSSTWSSPPFSKLNGPVSSISASSDGSSLFFGGNFTTSFSSNSSSNATLGNITSVPSAPHGVSTVGHSGYLTPIIFPYTGYIDPRNQISVTAQPTTSQHAYADPTVLLCPGEAVWLAQDDSTASIDVVGYNWLRALGARIVNGLVEGRGTTNFAIVGLPGKQQIELTYTDSNGKNQTCTDNCPLSTDSSVSAQDFIFTNGAQNVTGLEIQLKQWQGDGAGLGSIQLLSDGAYGSAVTNTNKPLCPGNSNSSSVQRTGNWSTQTYRESNPTIDKYYVTTTIPTNDVSHPQVTFYPYVSAAGFYDLYVVIPGCSQIGDCDGRTSVDIKVFPVQGSLGFATTISEQVQDDTMTLVYSGPVDSTSDSFAPTVTLALAQNPAQPKGNEYIVVAEAIDMFLTGVTTDSSASTSRTSGQALNGTMSISNTTDSVSFGLFEYVRSAKQADATSILANTSETALSSLGFALDLAYNKSGDKDLYTVNTIVEDSNTIYVGGSFSVSGNYSNVVSIDSGTRKSTSLANQGLNDVVYACVLVNGAVYFGGAFSSTQSGGTSLNKLAQWKSNSWSALGGGVDGTVTSLAAMGNKLLITGNFSHVSDSTGASTPSGGFAVWDTDKSQWDTSGVLFGTVSSAAVVNAADTTEAILAGKVAGTSANAVNSFAFLSTDSNGSPQISTLKNVDFSSTGSAKAAASNTTKRSLIPVGHTLSRSRITSTFINRLTDPFVRRDMHRRDTAPTIPTTSVTAPAVLAGTFWSNSSDSGNSVAILGGNFSMGNNIEGVAFYNENSNSPQLTGPNPPVQGLVKALEVVGHDVYVGGSGVNVSGVGSDLVVYDLQGQKWYTGDMAGLKASSGSVVVNAIKTRQNTNTVVVGGTFSNAGSLSCNALCLWDAEQAQWSTPGSGLQSGEVRAVDFAGDQYQVVIAAGSFVLPSGDVSFLASYSFDNSSWTGLGTLPGPAIAVAVDDKNSTNIFAAGYSTSGNTPYLQRWDGSQWATQNSSLLPGSLVSQLAFVPTSKEHTAHGSIESDRMLMVSGDLHLDDIGNATSALYDGAMMYPYLVATTSTGSLGSASGLFWSQSTFSFAVQHFLATGLVVLVAIAIATGLILMLILLFFLVACINRRRERNKPPPQEMFEKDQHSEVSSTHQHVFNNVQAALENSLAGGAIGGMAPIVIGKENNNSNNYHRRSDPSDYGTADGGVAAGEEYDDPEGDDEGRETTMRYDFDGPELQPGEMSMRAGQTVIILDDVQSHEWWYARDPATGREGVVPATYVW